VDTESITRAASSAAQGRSPACPFWATDEAVDDRQIKLAIPRPELVDHGAGSIDQIQLVAEPADPDRLPLDDTHFDRRREHAAERGVSHPRGLEEVTPAGVQIGGQDASTVERTRQGLHSALDNRTFPLTTMRPPAAAPRARRDRRLDSSRSRRAAAHRPPRQFQAMRGRERFVRRA